MNRDGFLKKMSLWSQGIAALLCLSLLSGITGCGKTPENGSNQTETVTSEAASAASDASAVSDAPEVPSYKEILSAEHISVEDAYEYLKDQETDDSEQKAFLKKLEDLLACSGKFGQKTESGNVYSADVTFYLSSGIVYGSVSYTNYRGEIKDGVVSETEGDEEYLFYSEPKGDLSGREQDFQIHYGKEKLHIQWADTCDYVLDRGDGSIESVEDYRVPYDQTDGFKAIVSTIDEHFPDTPHAVVYNADAKEVNLYFQAPDNLRTALEGQDTNLLEAWQNIVDSMTNLSEKLLTVVSIGGKAYFVNIYWVDRLNSDHSYTESDYLLWIRNDTVRYNYADQVQSSSVRTGGSGSAGNSTASAQNDRAATFGEKNALEQAYLYLDYTAFSYSGLVEQLEFEGFSHSEAVYAADHCGADWKEQAVKMAGQYLDYSSFSRSELLEQLEFEGFTHEQAEYAVSVYY